jgi:hypothetical protein
MRTEEEQFRGLMELAAAMSPAEVNFVINRSPRGDVSNLEMLDTPGSPQMVYTDESRDSYDFWSAKTGKLRLEKSDVPLEEAARIMINEYFSAKAQRIKKLKPDIPMDYIMKKLREGYQKPIDK